MLVAPQKPWTPGGLSNPHVHLFIADFESDSF